MYKIKKEHEGFEKDITLLWVEQHINPRHSYHPALGYHGTPGKTTFKKRNFWTLQKALDFINSEDCPQSPEYCEKSNPLRNTS